MTQQSTPKKLPIRVKNELKFRELTVKSKTLIANSFYRILFGSPQLAGFSSQGFDDHIKVFFPTAGATFAPPQITSEGIDWGNGPRPQSRDYTPLEFDAEKLELVLDFYIHKGGVASDWATHAQVGDKLTIGGPRGSLVIPTDYHWQLYITDESGLPAVRRRLQSLPNDVSAQILVNCHDAESLHYLDELAGAKVQRLSHSAIAELLTNITIPSEDYFIWLVGEGQEVKQLSDYLLETRGLDADLVRAVAYWHNK